MSAARRCIAWGCLVALTLVQAAAPLEAYLKFGVDVGGRQIAVGWPALGVPYFVHDEGAPQVSVAAFDEVLARAFTTWTAVPSSTITYRRAGLTPAVPGQEDGVSTLGFASAPELDRVLAQTSFLIDDETGALLESDIFFNTAVPWSTAANGEPGRWDLESIAVHEVGHFSGLGHSALGETERVAGGRRVVQSAAVMFPIALGTGNTSMRQLQPDDIAGISDLYPSPAFRQETGSISGRVTRGGRGVIGAHVVAFDLGTGALVANFTLTRSGRFSIAGLSPGPHALRIEPIDDADVSSFLSGVSDVDVGFRAAFFDRIVMVPRGGDSGDVEIGVAAP